jgi:hypothetical protein
VISTVTFDCDRRPIARNTSCIAGAWPRISGVSVGRDLDAGFAQALFQRAPDQRHGLVDVEGLGQVFEGAALEGGDRRIEVGEGGDDDDRQAGMLFLDGCSRSRPDSPGMRMSDTSTCGVSLSKRGQRVASVGEKLRVARFSRARAFSSTQRIDASSSTIQIGFMYSVLPA